MREISFLTTRPANVTETDVQMNLGLVVESFVVIPVILSLFSVRTSIARMASFPIRFVWLFNGPSDTPILVSSRRTKLAQPRDL